MESRVIDLVSDLRMRKVKGSQAVARLTAELLRSVVSQQRLSQTDHAAALINAVRSVGDRLIAADPVELVIGNIVKRVLHIIRQENCSIVTSDVGRLRSSDRSDNIDEGDKPFLPSVFRDLLPPKMLDGFIDYGEDSVAASQTPTAEVSDKSARSRSLKHAVIMAINELIEGIDICYEQIADQAVEHIHQDEVILTLGHSRTVMEFLCAAKEKKRSFRVFVAEGAPRFKGQAFAEELAARGLQTTLITDSAVFAIISRVNMVIAGVHAVMADGGVTAPVGLNAVALAARKHAVPVVVVAGTHKLCPLYRHNIGVLLNDMKSPSELLDFGDFSDCMDFAGRGGVSLHVVNPTFDYVPPGLISLLITDVGGHDPSFMFRLLADYYSADDLIKQQIYASQRDISYDI